MRKLIQRYGVDRESRGITSSTWPIESVDALIGQFGGLSFGNGIYRIATADVALSLENTLAQHHSIHVFGYDWLGRVFALREGAGQNSILLFEVGAGEVLEIPASLETLHEVELVEFGTDSLALGFFQQWRSANPDQKLMTTQCVGYIKPLFLGGADILENLEVTDLDVYVSMCVQLKKEIRRK